MPRWRSIRCGRLLRQESPGRNRDDDGKQLNVRNDNALLVTGMDLPIRSPIGQHMNSRFCKLTHETLVRLALPENQNARSRWPGPLSRAASGSKSRNNPSGNLLRPSRLGGYREERGSYSRILSAIPDRRNLPRWKPHPANPGERRLVGQVFPTSRYSLRSDQTIIGALVTSSTTRPCYLW